MNIGVLKRTGKYAALAVGAALIFVIGASVLPPLTSASAAVTQVSITVPGGIVTGSNFTANVSITNVAAFDAASYDISFDPAVLRLNSITNGSISGTVIPVATQNQRSPGTYSVVENVPGLNGVNGSGSLAVIQFSVIGPLGNGTSINLSNHVLSSNLAAEIPADWSGVSIPAVVPPATASFSLSGFSVMPGTVGLNEPVTVSVLVTNSGGAGGTYPVILKVNGVQAAAENVTLAGGQNRMWSALVTKAAAGTYTVDLNGNAGQFTVAVPTSATPTPTPSPTPTATQITLTTLGLSSGVLRVDASGIVTASSFLTTDDTKASLNIAKGTRVLDAQFNSIRSLSATLVTGPPAAPAGANILSAYDFGPNGAMFTPAVSLSMNYTPASLQGGNANNLTISYWDGTKWVALTSTVDVSNRTVTALTDHFSQFALISPAPVQTQTQTVPAVPGANTAPPAQTAPTLATSPANPPQIISQTSPVTPPPAPSSPFPSLNWVLIGLIAAVVIIIGFVIAVIVRRRVS